MSEIALPKPHAWLEIDENVFGQPVYRGVVHWTPDAIAGEHRRVPVYTAEQVRQLIAAEREANALKCEAVSEQAGTEWGRVCAAAIRR